MCVLSMSRLFFFYPCFQNNSEGHQLHGVYTTVGVRNLGILESLLEVCGLYADAMQLFFKLGYIPYTGGFIVTIPIYLHCSLITSPPLFLPLNPVPTQNFFFLM
jgi:hypothetical protein